VVWKGIGLAPGLMGGLAGSSFFVAFEWRWLKTTSQVAQDHPVRAWSSAANMRTSSVVAQRARRLSLELERTRPVANSSHLSCVETRTRNVAARDGWKEQLEAAGVGIGTSGRETEEMRHFTPNAGTHRPLAHRTPPSNWVKGSIYLALCSCCSFTARRYFHGTTTQRTIMRRSLRKSATSSSTPSLGRQRRYFCTVNKTSIGLPRTPEGGIQGEEGNYRSPRCYSSGGAE
jgi:hypothetical protein